MSKLWNHDGVEKSEKSSQMCDWRLIKDMRQEQNSLGLAYDNSGVEKNLGKPSKAARLESRLNNVGTSE